MRDLDPPLDMGRCHAKTRAVSRQPARVLLLVWPASPAGSLTTERLKWSLKERAAGAGNPCALPAAGRARQPAAGADSLPSSRRSFSCNGADQGLAAARHTRL